MDIEIDTRRRNDICKMYFSTAISRHIVRKDGRNVLVRDENFDGGEGQLAATRTSTRPGASPGVCADGERTTGTTRGCEGGGGESTGCSGGAAGIDTNLREVGVEGG